MSHMCWRFWCKNRGHDDIIRHSKKNIHIKNCKKYRDNVGKLEKLTNNQPDIITALAITSSANKLNFTDQVTKAETLWCTTLAVCNLPPVISDTILPVLPAIFPDSKIASSMTCKRTKSTYIIGDALGPTFKESFQNEIEIQL